MNNDHDENEAAAAAILMEKPTEDEIFLEAGCLEFAGRPLNTSASRYDFVTRFAAGELEEIGGASDVSRLPVIRDLMKKTIFVCQLGREEFHEARRDRAGCLDQFDRWNDTQNLVPSNQDKLNELMTVADKIWVGWNGAADPDEDTDGAPEESGKANGRR